LISTKPNLAFPRGFPVSVYAVSGDAAKFTEAFEDNVIVYENNSLPVQKLPDIIRELNRYPDIGQCVFRFEPTTTEEGKTGYQSIFLSLHNKHRMLQFVIPIHSRNTVTKFFLFSVEANKKLPACVLPFHGPGLPPKRQAENLLLGFCYCMLNVFLKRKQLCLTKIFLLSLVSTKKSQQVIPPPIVQAQPPQQAYLSAATSTAGTQELY
jgi:hypothetical protein